MRERLLKRLTGVGLWSLAIVLLGVSVSPQHAVADQPAGDKPWCCVA